MCSLGIPRDFKSSYFVLPSVLFIALPSARRASITSFGTALPDGIKSKLRARAGGLA